MTSWRRALSAWLAAIALFALAGHPRAFADEAAVPGRREATAARTALQTLLEQLVSNDRNMRRAAARSIEALGNEATPAMAEVLAKLRPGRPPAEVSAVLARARGGAEAGDAVDRLDAVLDLPPDAGGAAYAQAAVTLCLVRALSRTATPDAVATFVPVALDARGAFAPDVTRHLAALGERGIAGLVLASHGHGPLVDPWAAAQLEAMGTRTPGDAVQTKSKEVLADVLLAYGRAHDADALSVVLSFANADRRVVRDASREAMVEYGDLALPKLRETYGLLSGVAAPPDWPAAWLRKKLFEALDRVRLEDVDARVRAGLSLAEAGKFAEAVADFDDVLARQPDWDRKGELVPAYVFAAQAQQTTNPKEAASLFEKALALDPTGPRAAQIKSALALLEGQALAARGVTDEEPFRRALALDASNAAAAQEIERILDDAQARKRRWELRLTGLAAGVAVMSGLILFVGPRRRRVARRR